MPQVVGYQDYARVAAQAANVLFQQSAAISTWPNSAVLDGNGYGYIILDMQSPAGAADIWSVSVSFYADQAATIGLGSVNFVSQAGQFLNQQIPVLARYFQISRAWVSGPGTTVVEVYIQGMNQPMQEYQSTLFGQPFMASVASVPASSSVTLGPITPGFGTYKMAIASSGGNKWQVTVQYLDFVGATYQNMIFLFGADYGGSHMADIKLPAVPVQVMLQNIDTAAHTIWFSIV